MRTQCPKCNAATKIPDKYLSKMARCHKCQHIFVIKALTPPVTNKSQYDIPIQCDEATEINDLHMKCADCKVVSALRLMQEQLGKDRRAIEGLIGDQGTLSEVENLSLDAIAEE